MYTKELVDLYLKAAEYVNRTYGNFTFTAHFLFVGLLIVFLERAFSCPGKKSTIALSLLIWAVQIFGEVFIFLGKPYLGFFTGWISLLSFFLLGGLFALPAFISKHEFRLSSVPVHRIFGFLFMVGGAALYPFLEIVTGLKYPGIVLIGAECPTYIFMIGLMIACLPNVNKILAGILFGYGLISSVSAVSIGVRVDILYLAASVCGLALFVHWLVKSANLAAQRKERS